MTKNTKQHTPPTPLTFTHEELVVINNALNEMCNGVSFDDDEFQTRIGYPRAMAQNVLKKVAKALGPSHTN
ncbi:MAG: hypothetical protein C5B58_07935 [Acidobacteria bacterium]|nr:MAG: hypothetical protein C5B58_07935 [Acidobacteriota bacterium]